MHYNQTYKRETAREIAQRLRDGTPGTPVFEPTSPLGANVITSIGRRPSHRALSV